MCSIAALALITLGCACAWRWWWAGARAAGELIELPALMDARAQLRAQLSAHGLELALDERDAELSWRAPARCVEVYELRIDEAFRDDTVALFVGREPEHASWSLVLARHGSGVRAQLLPGDGSDQRARTRELWWSAQQPGPAAPDFACRRRSWDPLEDALALGWPRLPEGRVNVGEDWTGAAVEGRCHETTCLDPNGQFTHEKPCLARPWREQLAGAGDGLALLVGDWDDGHEPATGEGAPKIGILTSRISLLDDGRPLLVRAEVEHRWSGVHRSLSLTRIDDCGRRSLAGPEHAARVAEARAALW